MFGEAILIFIFFVFVIWLFSGKHPAREAAAARETASFARAPAVPPPAREAAAVRGVATPPSILREAGSHAEGGMRARARVSFAPTVEERIYQKTTGDVGPMKVIPLANLS
jgi:hypothetical protein